jgi:hypothetical protein
LGGRIESPALSRAGRRIAGDALEHGRIERSLGEPAGRTAAASGDTGSATHYALTGDAKLDLWYDASQQWSALRFVANDGSQVRYELT